MPEPTSCKSDAMVSLGTLKLPKEDAEKFLKAMEAYGIERSAVFLRRCAHALIKHHESGDTLKLPLAFQLGSSEMRKGKNYLIDANSCPVCGHELSVVASIEENDRAPEPGDVTLCINCGALLCITPTGALHRATKSDIDCLDYRQRHLLLKGRDFIKKRGLIPDE